MNKMYMWQYMYEIGYGLIANAKSVSSYYTS